MKFLYVAWRVLARMWLQRVVVFNSDSVIVEPPHSNDRYAALRAHSQASFPRFITSPQLPSPRTKFEIRFYIWYHAPGFRLLELSTGD